MTTCAARLAAAGVARAGAAAHAEDQLFRLVVDNGIQQPAQRRARVPRAAAQLRGRQPGALRAAEREVPLLSAARGVVFGRLRWRKQRGCARWSRSLNQLAQAVKTAMRGCCAPAAASSSDAAYMMQMRSALPMSVSAYLRFIAAQTGDASAAEGEDGSALLCALTRLRASALASWPAAAAPCCCPACRRRRASAAALFAFRPRPRASHATPPRRCRPAPPAQLPAPRRPRPSASKAEQIGPP